MQKVYIKGVPNRGQEVIAKLKSLGGKCAFEERGDLADRLYFIDAVGNICRVFIGSNIGTVLTWAGTEIFLDDEVDTKPKSTELKKHDSVMVSDDGVCWYFDMYIEDNLCIDYIDALGPHTERWTYIVPLSEFDFDDPATNIKKSIV